MEQLLPVHSPKTLRWKVALLVFANLLLCLGCFAHKVYCDITEFYCWEDHDCKVEWYEQKEAEARVLVLREPSNAEAHWHLSQVLRNWTGGYEGQAKELRLAIKLNPNIASWHYELGEALCGMKEYREATEEFEKALALAPTCENYFRAWLAAKVEWMGSITCWQCENDFCSPCLNDPAINAPTTK